MQHVKTIPVSIAQYVLRNNLVREFALLLAIKNNTAGHFHQDQAGTMQQLAGIGRKSTFEKQLGRLMAEGWIYRPAGGQYYNVLSFGRIAKLLKFNDGQHFRIPASRLVNIPAGVTDSIPKLRAFLFASVVGNFIKGTQFFYRNTSKGKRIVRTDGRAINIRQTLKNSYCVEKIGVSMDRIRKIIGFGRTYMNRMKISATKFGFLKCSANWYQIGRREFRRTIDQISAILTFKRKRQKCAIIGMVTGGNFLNTYLKNKGR